jgi:hypothetical protein
MVAKCRFPAQHALVALLAIATVACTAIAGVRDPDPIAKSSKRDAGSPTSGDSNATDIAVTVDSLDFGNVACGASTTVNLVVVNNSDQDRPYTIERQSDDSPFTSSKPTGTIPARDKVDVPLTVTPTVGGQVKNNIVVTSGNEFVTVPVTVVGQGAALDWAMSSVDLGETPLGTDGTAQVSLHNSGSAAAKIAGFSGANNDFDVTPSAATIQPGQDASFTVTLKANATPTPTPISTTIIPNVTGLCTAAPMLVARGSRVDTTVTVTGGDWGKQACNTSPPTRDVVIKNYYAGELKWSVTPTTKFKLNGGATTGPLPRGTIGAVAGTGTTPGQITLTYKAPPTGATPAPITEDITVAVTLPNGQPIPGATPINHPITLQIDVRGSIVALSASSLDFATDKNGQSSNTFKISNSGNEQAWIVWGYQRSGGPAWTGIPQQTFTNPSGTTTVDIGYTPSDSPPDGATLTPFVAQGSWNICNISSLSKVTLTGNGS